MGARGGAASSELEYPDALTIADDRYSAFRVERSAALRTDQPPLLNYHLRRGASQIMSKRKRSNLSRASVQSKLGM